MRVSNASWLLVPALPLLVLTASDTASAEPSAADRQAATILFKDGKQLLDKGQVAQACRKLEDSQRLDPAAGTLLNLAVCHEKEGRTASAWFEFTDALSAARRDNRAERIKLAEDHIAVLEPKLLRLTVEVPKESDLPDLVVQRDGAALARAGWGSATPVDPGPHVLEAKAPGRIGWKENVTIEPGTPNRTVKVPVLAVDPDAGKTPPPPPPALSSSVEAPPPVAKAPPPSSGKKTTGLIFAAAGGGLVILGGVVGLAAKAKFDDATKGDCPSATGVCTQSASDKTKEAGKLADAGTGLAVLGGVALGVGIYLIATAPPSTASASRVPAKAASRFVVVPAVGREGAGAFVSGAF